MARITAQELLHRYADGERRFSRANLVNADLRDAKLRDIDLAQSDLRGADLRNADFRNSNFAEANLTGANFRSAKLVSSNFAKANLEGANLQNAAVDDATLAGANLTAANLKKASFGASDLSSVNLSRAIIDKTVLCESVLALVDFTIAHVHSAQIGWTVFAATKLGPLCSAENEHLGPSYIDWLTITKSYREPNLTDFLLQAGIPHIAVIYTLDCVKAVEGKGLFSMMRSTFISYGKPDEQFAQKLHVTLRRSGVQTFFFPEHAIAGEKLHRMMRRGVNTHDRVILICSKQSLNRKGVLNEIEEVLAREARDGGENYLIPIRLDDFIFTDWKPSRPDIAQTIRDRVIADFSDTLAAPEKFDVEVAKLLRALRKSPVPDDLDFFASDGAVTSK